jgi:hypothetical protein
MPDALLVTRKQIDPLAHFSHRQVVPLRVAVIDENSEIGFVSRVRKDRLHPLIETLDGDFPGRGHSQIFRPVASPSQLVLQAPSVTGRLCGVKAALPTHSTPDGLDEAGIPAGSVMPR